MKITCDSQLLADDKIYDGIVLELSPYSLEGMGDTWDVAIVKIKNRLGVADFDRLNSDMHTYAVNFRARVEAMSVWERREYLTFVADGFFLVDRLQRFAEDRDFLGKLAQEELNKIPAELKQAYKQFPEYLDPKTALLDFDLPHFRLLDAGFRESQSAGRDWDRRFKAHVQATAPETLIWLEHRNYWKHDDIGSKERASECFISEAELNEFLNCWHQAEWTDYCNGHGDPSLSYLEIRIKRPGGDWEDYNPQN